MYSVQIFDYLWTNVHQKWNEGRRAYRAERSQSSEARAADESTMSVPPVAGTRYGDPYQSSALLTLPSPPNGSSVERSILYDSLMYQ